MFMLQNTKCIIMQFKKSQQPTDILKAWARSAIRSSAFSRPTLSLMRLLVTPRATRSFSSMEACVMR